MAVTQATKVATGMPHLPPIASHILSPYQQHGMLPDATRTSSSCLAGKQAWIGAALQQLTIAQTNLQLAELNAASAYIDDNQLRQLLHKVQGVKTLIIMTLQCSKVLLFQNYPQAQLGHDSI